MDDKPAAGLITAIVIAPLVALCCLGPVFIASAAAGVGGWLSGGLVWATMLALLAAAIGYAAMRWRRASSRGEDVSLTCVCDEPKARQAGELDPVGLGAERRGRLQHSSPSDTHAVAPPSQATRR